MSMKAFSSKISGKGYSFKNATVQCIQVLYLTSSEIVVVVSFVRAFSLGHNLNQCWPGRLQRELSGVLGGKWGNCYRSIKPGRS